MSLLAELRSRFRAALAPLIDEPDEYAAMVKPAQDPRFGDFQANCAMPLKGKLGAANARDVAEQIVENLDVGDLCEPAEIAGPGFINLRVRDDWLRETTAALAADERLGSVPTDAPQTVVVDYSAPNVAKPMHVGHLRSTVIGDALKRILAFLGHKVIGDNHIGDWGTQFGMIIYGYKHFLDEKAFAADPVAELARLYRLVNRIIGYHEAVAALPDAERRLEEKRKQLEDAEASAGSDKKSKKLLKKLRAEVKEFEERISGDDPGRLGGLKGRIEDVESEPQLRAIAAEHHAIAVAAREETAALHAGDPENNRLWHEFLPMCLEALNSVYERLGICFELQLGESFYQPMLAGVVADLESKGLAAESEGAACVFNEGFEAPFIIRKQDGAFNYATTDLATIKYRVEELHADAVLYVVDARQSEHFDQLFTTAKRWGYTGTAMRHVKFGTVMGPDGKPFKTRSGDTVGLESLLDESIARARKIVDANDDAKPEPELDEGARADVAVAVGLGGIKYADLRHNRESDYVFDWDKMLATRGDTAAYMQYACARIAGIFRKGGIDRSAFRESGGQVVFAEPEERRLALQLVQFADAVESAARELKPNLLTQFLFETAEALASFYANPRCQVLKAANEELKSSRLLLCDLTGRVLERGLALLGIETRERM